MYTNMAASHVSENHLFFYIPLYGPTCVDLGGFYNLAIPAHGPYHTIIQSIHSILLHDKVIKV